LKFKINSTTYQSVLGDAQQSNTVGFIRIIRLYGNNAMDYIYTNGTSAQDNTYNLFPAVDNQ